MTSCQELQLLLFRELSLLTSALPSLVSISQSGMKRHDVLIRTTQGARPQTRFDMILSDREVIKLRKLLSEIDKGLDKKKYKTFVETRTRNIRLVLSKAERREKNTLL